MVIEHCCHELDFLRTNFWHNYLVPFTYFYHSTNSFELKISDFPILQNVYKIINFRKYFTCGIRDRGDVTAR